MINGILNICPISIGNVASKPLWTSFKNSHKKRDVKTNTRKIPNNKPSGGKDLYFLYIVKSKMKIAK